MSAVDTSVVSKKPSVKRRRPSTRSRWTQEEVEILRDMYATHLASEVSKRLGRSVGSIYGMVEKLGIRKGADWKNHPKNKSFKKGHTGGWRTWYEKGMVSHNKGKKWDEYTSKEAQEKMRKSTFTKGHTPANSAKDGDIRQRYHKKDKRTYMYIRIAPMKWEPLHRHNWVMANGPIPKSHKVMFKDRNTLNCDLDNLELISIADNMKRNSIHALYPEDIKQTILKLGHLKRIINGKKQDQ